MSTIKEFNSNTMTRAAFFGMIRASLRRSSRYWKPILECKKDARRKYNGNNKRQKWEYKCNFCKKHFPDKEVQVDHIIPCGRLNDFDDLPNFVRILFSEKDNFQVLCKNCHLQKTEKEKNNGGKSIKIQRRKAKV